MINPRKNISDLLIWKIIDATSCDRSDHGDLPDKVQSDSIERYPGLCCSGDRSGDHNIICLCKKRDPSECMCVTETLDQSTCWIVVYSRSTIDRCTRKHNPSSILTPGISRRRTYESRISQDFISTKYLRTIDPRHSMSKVHPPYRSEPETS